MNKTKKIFVMALICVMFVAVFPTFSNTSSAQNVVPTISSVKYGYNGYDGNGAIYLVKYGLPGSSSIPRVELSSLNSGISKNCYDWCGQTNRCWVNTSSQIALGINSPSDPVGNSSYIYSTCGLKLTLNPISMGHETFEAVGDAWDRVASIENSISISGFGKNNRILGKYYPKLNTGVNLSNCESSWGSNPTTKAYSQVVSYGIGLIPVLGQIYSATQLAYELKNDFGPTNSPTSQTSISCSDGTIYQTLGVDNGTFKHCYMYPGQNNYLSVTNATFCIPFQSLASGSNCNIAFGTQSIITNGGSTVCHIGASSSVSIPLEQSISICGYAFDGGKAAVNQNVCLVQTYNGINTGFQLTTNNMGFWHFYAEPGATYELTGQNLSNPGCSSSWDYSVFNIPSNNTSVANTGKAFRFGGEGTPAFELNTTNLNGHVSANGNPVTNAEVYMEINGQSESVLTNSAGYFTLYVPFKSSVTVSIYAPGYSFSAQTIDTSTQISVSLTFSCTSPPPSGGGGGGCVLYGTNITLAKGLTTQVQNLHKGEKILSYNTHTHKLFKDKVKQVIITHNVTSVIRIDN
ncbi:MAG: peptidase associated/transthyretin-like domain-containing protein, partial [Thermoplasmataceae archaeon]